MTSREQFEAWYKSKYLFQGYEFDKLENGSYQWIESMWQAWQASRLAIEIKLPNQACLATWHYAGCGPDDYYEDIEISRNPSKDKSVDGTEPFPLLTKWEVEQAIEQAGLKVKK